MLLVTGCDKANLSDADLTDLKDQIASINKQIESMQKTLDLLKQTNSELEAEIEELKASGGNGGAIAELQEKQAKLEKQIKSLEEAINGTKDWASTTFATLEQQKELSGTLASLSETVKNLQAKLDGFETSLDKKIEECEASMQNWINEKLSGYYTIAEAYAAIDAMKENITEGDKALQDQIDALEKELSEMEERLTAAYEKAIEEALANNGVIPPSVDLDDINAELNSLLAEINTKIANLEIRIDEIEKQLEALVNRVQSVYSKGTHTGDASESLILHKKVPFGSMENTVSLDYVVTPKNVVSELAEKAQNALSLHVYEYKKEYYEDGYIYIGNDLYGDEYYYTIANVYQVPISSCKADAENGILTVDLTVADFPEEMFFYCNMYGEVSYSTVLCISDGINQIHANGLDTYCEYTNLNYYFNSGDEHLYISKKANTWKWDKGNYGVVSNEESIISVLTNADCSTNAEKWFKPALDKTNNDITISVTENTSAVPRSEVMSIITDKSLYRVWYTQYCEEGVLEADTTELNFSYFYDREKTVTIYHRENTEISVINNYEWIEVSVFWTDDSETLTPVYIRVDEQRELSDVAYREGTITIKDNRGNSVDVKVTQDLLTLEKATIKVDKSEVSFPYTGGTETITLTHPENAEIRVLCPWEFEYEVIPVNETTSTLEIAAREFNRESEAREATLEIYLGDLYFDVPVTEIKVIQAAYGDSSIENSEIELLMSFYYSTNGDNWINNTNWCTDKPLDEWYGISTDTEGNITSIALSDNNITGSASLSFKPFKKLNYFDINNNDLDYLWIEANDIQQNIELNNCVKGGIEFKGFTKITITDCDSLYFISGSCEELVVSDCVFAKDASTPFSDAYAINAKITQCTMHSCGLRADSLTFESSSTYDTWHCVTETNLNITDSYCSTICSGDFNEETIINLNNATLWRSNWDEDSLVTLTCTVTGSDWYNLFE